MMKNNSALFYTCSLIEYIGRNQKQKRSTIVEYLGRKTIKRIYDYADIFHCEPIEKTADDFVTRYNIPMGSFDNVTKCRYDVPDYWTIGEVYERLIEDISDDNPDHIIDNIMEVYLSWINDRLSNYNTDLFYQSREYIRECYREGKICA
ncbi:MAG: hypothetical protein Q4E53_13095 [Eubacteriales bacterium]|nr:hypothetical protein [Eubacteriales bacterium]